MRTNHLTLLLGAPFLLAACVGTVGQRTPSDAIARESATGADGGSVAVGVDDAGRPIAADGAVLVTEDGAVSDPARADGSAGNSDGDAGEAPAPSGPPAPSTPPRLGPPGTWNNVTPQTGLTLGEFGIQTMLADPARPSDFYFTSTNTPGVFKSTDFGKTWARISSFRLMYACTCDPNPRRDPSTPLTIFCGGGYGNGVARSRDGGVTWTLTKTNNAAAGDFGNDPYSFDIDPYDSRHVLVAFHGVPGLSESTDGGDSWRDVTSVGAAQGTSNYPFFIDAGNAAATRGNWLMQSQWGDGANGGIQRTTDGGRTWRRADALQHPHGASQIFQAGEGVIYAAGLEGSEGHGIYRSSDYGMSWSRVNDGTPQNAVFGTTNYLYADYGWAIASGQTQKLQRSPRNQGTQGTWEVYAPDAGLVNGSAHAAVSYDASSSRWVIVIAGWTGGVYRYEEP